MWRRLQYGGSIARIGKIGGKMKKVSSEWIKEYNCKIYDPDGWDRKNFEYSFNEEKITRKEFERRLLFSTIHWWGKLSELRKKQ